MESARLHCFLIFFFAFAAIIPTLTADIADFDEVWQKRAQEAQKAALKAYEPNPSKVTDALNQRVFKALKGAKLHNSTKLEANFSNNTRRQLGTKKYKGPCKFTNPIDRCWRCRPDWHLNRKKLADCALGFGHKATGGKDGRYYVVTDRSDDSLTDPKPGTLRHAVIQKEPLWIIFARSMTIRLNAELIMEGDKTIDARGANVHIAYGAGITIQFIKNVIIHNLHIHDIVQGNGGQIRDSVDHIGFRTMSDGDGISIFGSSDIWIDHISMRRCYDGLIDVIQASTAITISNCHFTDHNEVMLLGAHDDYPEDEIMQVTLAFNHFGKRLVQRMPRCRWGFIHIVNNDYTHWQMYAIGGSSHPTIISQGNRFIAPNIQAAKEVTKRDYAPESVWKSWTWRSDGDYMLNGAFFVQSGNPNGVKEMGNRDKVKAEPGTAVTLLTRFAGSLRCRDGKPC
uniref:Pectate lyase n=1 Tax=Davidia involucrata TaxID=16924 RepID=A0A5B7BUA9_DAVIN